MNDAATKFPTILLPLDLSSAGETKIPVAIEYARLLGASVVLLHVLPRRDLESAEVSAAEARARTYLDTVAAQIESAGVAAAAVIRRGSPPVVIVAEARLLEARMILLSTTSRPLMAAMMHTTVADQVVRTADCPVLLVRPEPGATTHTHTPRSFAEDALRMGALTRRRIGVRTIEVARIVGSVDRAEELGTDFRRRGFHRITSIDEQRYQRVLEAAKKEVFLPPINVYKLGFGYYVEDGHHRVAAALATGQTEIDADVIEFFPAADEHATALFAARAAFERATGLTDINAARPETYADLLQTIETYARDQRLTELPLAARRWEREVFRPLWRTARDRELTAAFPGELSADVVGRLCLTG